MRHVDVVVAGGGLAGAVAAAALTRGGLRVLMAERKADPGAFNYCAEAVSARAIAPFDVVDADLVAAPVDAGLLVGPGEVRARLLWPGAGYVLHRDRLMRRLFERAVEAGCDACLEHEVVDVHRDRQGRVEAVSLHTPAGEERVACNVVVAADGIAGGVGRLAGIDTLLAVKEIFACAQYRLTGIAVEEGTLEFWIGDEFAPGGYAWVFPRASDEANVGLAMVADRPSAAGETATVWLKRFRRRRFPVGTKIESYITGGIPTLVRPAPASAQGVILAGDAARTADPLSAAGIAEAMASGRHAAQAVLDAVAAGDLSAARLASGARAFARAHRGRPVTSAIRRVYDRLDDEGKRALACACRDLFHERRIDTIDPRAMFLDLLRHGPGLLRYARLLLMARA